MSCDNCTHTAVGADPTGWYVQRDIGGVWTTDEMSGYGWNYGLNDGFWDSVEICEDENTIVSQLIILSYVNQGQDYRD